jgi:hypothetical protein
MDASFFGDRFVGKEVGLSTFRPSTEELGDHCREIFVFSSYTIKKLENIAVDDPTQIPFSGRSNQAGLSL